MKMEYNTCKTCGANIGVNKTMDKLEAFEILREFANELIKDIYDIYDDATDALFVILPTFEYPDWNYHTVAAFLRSNGHII